MAAREGVRSSARLSVAGGGAQQPAPAAAASEAEREAAAVLRRQRAARAAERAREVEDSPQVLRDKCRRLARALREAKHLVVYTGAGISTAADIPDYRGPHGVWTRLQRGETVGRVEVSRAQPTFTHMALTALWARGVLKFVVSQNCDGLHMRAGLPRRALAELHGDMFAERCPACRAVYLRAFDTTERTARHTHATRRLCHACAPARELRDSIVHFGERGRAAWPLNWSGALRHAAAADVVLCLGSSLKVLRRYPRLWRMQSAPHTRPALYIVNLQWTPKDSVAALKINARCDAVMAQVARRLRLRVPRYRPSADPLLAHAEPLTPAEAHTTRRPLLSPAPTSDFYEVESDDDSYYSLSASSSTSDSDDELPLRRLADRLRSPRPPPAPPPPSAPHTLHAPEPPEPVAASIPELHSFQVNLQSGETTIILRSEHAPLYTSPAEPQVARSTTDALRRYRITRPMVSPAINGLTTNGHRFPEYDLNGRELKNEFPCRSKIKKEESPCPPHENGNGTWNLGPKLHCLLDAKCTRDVKLKQESDSGDDEASASLAAAIIRRAVLMCRAQLYPGLHTIIAPAAPAPAPSPAIRVLAPDTGPRVRARGECSWCLRRYKTRRCLWYGPPRATAPERRVWRRERGTRYLCACCGEDSEPVQGEVGTIDDGGWYGKGYRKGRRRRR